MKKRISEVLAIYNARMQRARLSDNENIEAYMDAMSEAWVQVVETNCDVLDAIREKFGLEDDKSAFSRFVKRITNSKKKQETRLAKHECLSIDSTFRNTKGESYTIEGADYRQERNTHHNEVIEHIESLLKESDKPIFEMYHIKELTRSQIAGITGKDRETITRRLAVIATKINGSGLRDILDSKLSENIGEITGAKHHTEQTYDMDPSECKRIDVADHKSATFNPPNDVSYASKLSITVPTKKRDVDGVSVLGAIRCADNGYRRMVE